MRTQHLLSIYDIECVKKGCARSGLSAVYRSIKLSNIMYVNGFSRADIIIKYYTRTVYDEKKKEKKRSYIFMS